jgi:hypothetical protein
MDTITDVSVCEQALERFPDPDREILQLLRALKKGECICRPFIFSEQTPFSVNHEQVEELVIYEGDGLITVREYTERIIRGEVYTVLTGYQRQIIPRTPVKGFIFLRSKRPL